MMIIGVVGRIAAGKGVVVEYLENKGFEYYTVSKMVREEASKRGIEITRGNLQDLGNLIRNQEGAGAWMNRILVKLNPENDYVIDGIRNPGEIHELRKSKNFYLISIDAPQKERYERMLERAKPSDPKDWGGFLVMDKRDFAEENLLGQQVGRCMELADFHLMNDSSLEDFQSKIDEVYSKIKC